MPRYLLSFLFLFYFIFSFYFMLCFVLTSPPLMLCVYLQTFEAALFWKKKKKKSILDKTKADTSVAVAVLFRNLRIDAKRRSSK